MIDQHDFFRSRVLHSLAGGKDTKMGSHVLLEDHADFIHW